MSHRLLEDFAHIASDWFWEMDAELRFTYFSERIAAAIGESPDVYLGKSRLEVAANSADPAFWQPHIDDLLARRPFRDFVYPARLSAESPLWLCVSGQPHFSPDGTFLGYRGVGSDVTALRNSQDALDRAYADLQEASLRHIEQNEALRRTNEELEREIARREQLEAELRRVAVTDTLTGLANLALLQEQFACALAKSQRDCSQIAVLYLDLDRFKAVNDTMGHGAGDLLLRQVATRLRDVTRKSDCVARIGGDEFVVLQTQVLQPEAAATLAARAVDAVSAPYEFNGRRATVGASIGIALYPEDGESGEELLGNADVALYRAKAAGRNTFRFYDDTIGAMSVQAAS